MREGLLWFDDNAGRSLLDKIERAANRYRQKYGHVPNVCYVHPTMIDNQEAKLGALRLVAAHNVLPNHFWLGVMEASNS